MIFFKCGRQGHKEDACVLEKNTTSEEGLQQAFTIPDKADTSMEVKERNYGGWMLVKKPGRRNNGCHQPPGTRTRGQAQGESSNSQLRMGLNRAEPNANQTPTVTPWIVDGMTSARITDDDP